MNWKRGTLTDSGGFQMVSLLDLADISVRMQNSSAASRTTPEENNNQLANFNLRLVDEI